jgi:hypothetical protein
MQNFRAIVAVLVLVTFTNLGYAAQVQVVSLTGNVTARGVTQPERTLKQGDLLSEGVQILTGPGGRAVLRFDDGQVVALKSATTFTIANYSYDAANPGAGRVVMSLLAGGMRVITGAIGRTNRQAFTLRTQTATMGIRGTDFAVVLAKGDYAQVLDGSISITTQKGTQVVNAGQTAFSAGANTLPATIAPGSVPPGLFTDVLSIPVGGAAGGAAAGAGAGMSVGVGAAVGIGAAIAIGIGAAAAASGGGSSTTNH